MNLQRCSKCGRSWSARVRLEYCPHPLRDEPEMKIFLHPMEWALAEKAGYDMRPYILIQPVPLTPTTENDDVQDHTN